MIRIAKKLHSETKGSAMSVSVIMPTIGRVPISIALKSVIDQTYPVLEILIIDSSELGIPVSDWNLSPKVRLIRNSPNTQDNSKPVWTAAHNRNIGILEAKGIYLALIDDDDEWLPDKLSIQMKTIGNRLDILSTTSVVYRTNNGKCLIRPKTLLQSNHSFLNRVYKKPTFFRSSYYLATPTVVVPSAVAKKVLFDESLSWFEDTWWYHNLELAGLKHEQLANPLTVVHADPERSIRRDSISKNLEWANQLAAVNKKYGFSYLCGIAFRNAVWLRRWNDLPSLLYNAIKIRFRKSNNQ
jgi:glycosyltransferase involved in cell wall biosynthesis